MTPQQIEELDHRKQQSIDAPRQEDGQGNLRWPWVANENRSLRRRPIRALPEAAELQRLVDLAQWSLAMRVRWVDAFLFSPVGRASGASMREDFVINDYLRRNSSGDVRRAEGGMPLAGVKT